jgi:hypothetical protein
MYFDDECETCDREFGSQQAAIQHMDALNHWGPRYECDTCDREFFTQRSADQHMDDKGHWEPQFECESCNKKFHTQLSADQHMDARNHHKRHHCHDCSKSFQNENALRMVCFFMRTPALTYIYSSLEMLLTIVNTSARALTAARILLVLSVKQLWPRPAASRTTLRLAHVHGPQTSITIQSLELSVSATPKVC